jgi:hypothetical protein
MQVDRPLCLVRPLSIDIDARIPPSHRKKGSLRFRCLARLCPFRSSNTFPFALLFLFHINSCFTTLSTSLRPPPFSLKASRSAGSLKTALIVPSTPTCSPPTRKFLPCALPHDIVFPEIGLDEFHVDLEPFTTTTPDSRHKENFRAPTWGQHRSANIQTEEFQRLSEVWVVLVHPFESWWFLHPEGDNPPQEERSERHRPVGRTHHLGARMAASLQMASRPYP